jgi:hypothetical protein
MALMGIFVRRAIRRQILEAINRFKEFAESA